MTIGALLIIIGFVLVKNIIEFIFEMREFDHYVKQQRRTDNLKEGK
jgi:hypothetical protein